MEQAAIVIGAYLLGWLLPEMVFILSPHADKFGRVPMMQNVVSAFGVALIAFGLSA
jgi:hypothetical protein